MVLRTESRYNNKISKEMATLYARLLNQYMFKNHSLFSASIYRINEEDQRSDEFEIFFTLNVNHSLTETDSDKIDVKS